MRRQTLILFNTNRSGAAVDVATSYREEIGAPVLLLTEPNMAATAGRAWLRDNGGSVAVWTAPGLTVMESEVADGVVWVRLGGVTLVVVYISPNTGIVEFGERVAHLEDIVRARRGPIIVAGDFNAKNRKWGGLVSNRRGYVLDGAMASLGLVTLQSGQVPTLVRRNGVSFVDVAFATEELAGTASCEEVREGESLSDR